MKESVDSVRHLIHEIAEEYRRGYEVELPSLQEKIFGNLSTDEKRTLLSQQNPEHSKQFEAMTQEEIEERIREIARSVAVARAIVFALAKTGHLS